MDPNSEDKSNGGWHSSKRLQAEAIMPMNVSPNVLDLSGDGKLRSFRCQSVQMEKVLIPEKKAVIVMGSRCRGPENVEDMPKPPPPLFQTGTNTSSSTSSLPTVSSFGADPRLGVTPPASNSPSTSSSSSSPLNSSPLSLGNRALQSEPPLQSLSPNHNSSRTPPGLSSSLSELSLDDSAPSSSSSSSSSTSSSLSSSSSAAPSSSSSSSSSGLSTSSPLTKMSNSPKFTNSPIIEGREKKREGGSSLPPLFGNSKKKRQSMKRLSSIRTTDSETKSGVGSSSPSKSRERDTEKARALMSKFKINDQFCCEDTPDNIILESEEGSLVQVIRAATVEKLVQRVSYEGMPDPKLLDDFLLTYRSFITPQRLMQLLTERYQTKTPSGLTKENEKEFNDKFLRPVRLRIYNLCKHWVNKYNADFTDDPSLSKEFQKWLEKLFQKEPTLNAKKLCKELNDYCAQKKKKEKKGREQKKPDPILPEPVSGARTLLDFSPKEVARQIALIEMGQYTLIKPWELLNQCWTKESGGADHVRAMISWSTRVSQLIATEIIKVPIDKKKQMISQCIQIGAECEKLNNYNAVMEIIAGFSNSAVNRLQPFFKEVPKKDQKILTHLKNLLSSDKNFRAMRDAIKTAEPPILPYLGTFLTDLTFIEDGNPDKVQDLINFKKCRLQSQVIRNIMQYQQIDYNFEVVPEIKKYLETGMIMDNKVLYKVSIKHLPRDAKEASVRELQKKRKAETKEGSAAGESSNSVCRNSTSTDETLRLIEEDEDYGIVNMCNQNVSQEDLQRLSEVLRDRPNVHTLRLCHHAYSLRNRMDAWNWMGMLRHVKALDLSNQDLILVPPPIDLMENLAYLILSGNKIDALPPTIGNLTKLEELKCDNNFLVDLPSQLEHCKTLRTISVRSNKLIKLGEFLIQLPELRYLNVSDNPIQHPNIPPELLVKGGSELLSFLRSLKNW